MGIRGILAVTILAVSWGALVLAAQARAANLTVTVYGLKDARGHITLSLYDRPERWLKDNQSVVDTEVPARAGQVTAVFHDLKPGRYAVVTMDDDDDSGHMRFTLLGLPEKGYAFSNNVRPFLKAPSFNRAAVTIGTANAAITIRMVYP